MINKTKINLIFLANPYIYSYIRDILFDVIKDYADNVVYYDSGKDRFIDFFAYVLKDFLNKISNYPINLYIDYKNYYIGIPFKVDINIVETAESSEIENELYFLYELFTSEVKSITSIENICVGTDEYGYEDYVYIKPEKCYIDINYGKLYEIAYNKLISVLEEYFSDFVEKLNKTDDIKSLIYDFLNYDLDINLLIKEEEIYNNISLVKEFATCIQDLFDHFISFYKSNPIYIPRE